MISTNFQKYKNLTLFFMITFGRSCVIVMFKFFLWSSLKELRSLEEIVGFVSLGCILAFFVGGALAYTYKKRYITIGAGILTIGAILCGIYTGYQSYWLFIMIMMLIGMGYGIRLTVKGVYISSKIINDNISETVMNGVANIALLLGMLLGCYRGFVSYDIWGIHGIWAVLAVLGATTLLTFLRGHNNFHPKQSLKQAISQTFPEIIAITKRHFGLLITIGVLRATSTAIGQKMLELGIETFNKAPKNTVRIIAFSMIGTVLGHIISAFFQKKKVFLSGAVTILFAVAVIFFPYFLDKHWSYLFLKQYSFLLGVLLGFIVNILEGRYFHLIGDEKMKENGSAAYGVANNIVVFGIMIGITCITKVSNMWYTFSFLGAALIACLPLIRRMK